MLDEVMCSEIVCSERLVDRPHFYYRDNHAYETNTYLPFRVKQRANTTAEIPEKMGGALTYNGFCHTFDSLLPEKKYFAEHPEYYALHDGKRTKAQPCLSNPEVLKIVTEEVLQRLRDKKAYFVSVSQNDNYDFCQCDECRRIDEEEGSHAGTLIRFVNAVAGAVAKEFPDVRVDTLAYTYTRKRPKITKPAKNVTVRLCSIECCFRHPIYDGNCPENVNFCNDIREWGEVSDDLFLWDYVTDYFNYAMPFPNLSVLRQNMRFYADHGVRGMLPLGTYNGRGTGFDELRTYLVSKLLWDPYMPAEEYEYHINDFLKGYYGKGWEYLKKYLTILDETTLSEHIGCFTSPKEIFRKYLARLDEIYGLFDKAAELAETEEQKKRIRIARIAPLYVSIFCEHDERKLREPEKLLEDKKKYYNELVELKLKPWEHAYYTKEPSDEMFEKAPDEWKCQPEKWY